MKQYIFILWLAVIGIMSSCKKSTSYVPGNIDTDPPPPTFAITSFSPRSAPPGTNITIKGIGFGTNPSAVQVAIGDAPYDNPISVTPTSMVVKTTLATTSGKIKAIVNGNGVVATSASDFTALPPPLQISGYLENGQLGHVLYISGLGFGTDTNKIGVSFGGTTPVKPNYIAADGAAIGAIVPRYAQEGKITVTANGQTVTGSPPFSFLMSIRDYSPKAFHVGDTVKITGVQFTTISDMQVGFNTQFINPISVTPTEMHVIVPYGAKSGLLTVSAGFGTITDYTSDKFTVLPK